MLITVLLHTYIHGLLLEPYTVIVDLAGINYQIKYAE